MTEDIIQSTDDLIGLIEADAVCLLGIQLCDVDLVTGALRILMNAGRRLEVTAIEVTDDDRCSDRRRCPRRRRMRCSDNRKTARRLCNSRILCIC
jgi:hypothetical protein